MRALLGGKKDGASFGRGALEKELGIKLDDPKMFGGSAASMRAIAAAGKDGFRLRDRALHVYSEAGRVYAFRNVCKVGRREGQRTGRQGVVVVVGSAQGLQQAR